ncbi:MAG: hypothetical protein JXR10_08400 [Cyclobacteriaceae bacterium]
MIKRLLPLLLLWSCQNSEDSELLINAHKLAVGDDSHIKTIVTKANCKGPEGAYYTETHSSYEDNYLLFLQDYTFKPNPFNAVIFDWKVGQGLNTNLEQQGALSNAVIAVLKAHEFHEVMLRPEDRFENMRVIEDTTYFGQKCHQILASDPLGLPVRVYFDIKSNFMVGFSEVNPYKKGEVIRVHFEEWKTNDDELKLFSQVTIRQGESSVYTLNYEEVLFNAPIFKRLSQEKM